MRNERGASLVEAAVVLPFVILLLLGVVDFGRVFFTEINLNNAVSEGALYAAQFPDNYSNTQTRVLEAGADLSLDPNDITVVCVPDPGTLGDPQDIIVQATIDVDMITPVGQWFGSVITLESEATATNTQVNSKLCDSGPP